MPRIGLLCSAHGFGHLARQLAVAEALLAQGDAPEVWTAAPPAVVHDYLPGLPVVSIALDVGLVQRDSLHEDLPATARALERFTSEQFVDGLAQRLDQSGLDAVVVDTAPAALEAARRAGVPALAAGNFDWAWIYSHYPQLQRFAAQFARWQAPHRALRMTPGPALHHFGAVEDVGLVGRWRAPQRVDHPGIHVLVSFGGLGLDALSALLPAVPGVTWLLAPPMAPLDRPDCVFVTGVSYPALVGGADWVLTKPGYGIYAETALAGTPVILLPRPGFPESGTLQPAFEARGAAVLVPGSREQLAGQLAAIVGSPPPTVTAESGGGACRIAQAARATAGSAPA